MTALLHRHHPVQRAFMEANELPFRPLRYSRGWYCQVVQLHPHAHRLGRLRRTAFAGVALNTLQHFPTNVCQLLCSKEEFTEVQQELAQVLFSLNAGQQAAALLRSEVANDGYYKVGGGPGKLREGCCCMTLILCKPMAAASRATPMAAHQRPGCRLPQVPFEQVPDLVAARRVYLQVGLLRVQPAWAKVALDGQQRHAGPELQDCCMHVATSRPTATCLHAPAAAWVQAGYAYVSKDQMSSLVVQPFRCASRPAQLKRRPAVLLLLCVTFSPTFVHSTTTPAAGRA